MERREVSHAHCLAVQSVIALCCPGAGRIYYDALLRDVGLHYTFCRELHIVGARGLVDMHGIALIAGGSVTEIPCEGLATLAAGIDKLCSVHIPIHGELRL